MMATSNSEEDRPQSVRSGWRRRAAYLVALIFALWFFAFDFVSAAPGQSLSGKVASTNSTETARQRFKRLYLETRHRWQKETNSDEAGWQFARACFDWADFSLDDSQRASLAEEGIAASRTAIRLAPKSAAGHYYLGLNLGQLAQTKMLGALRLIDQMEAAWLKTLELDPKFDYAGGHRALTLLYRDAPGWPTSVGNRSKARGHLLKAIELAPNYPGNRICWAESLLEWREVSAVRTQLESVELILEAARAKFTGEQWARDWQDWDRQWIKIRARAGKPAKAKR